MKLSAQSASMLMPLHLHFDPMGQVVSIGDTLQKMCPELGQVGCNLNDIFEIRRPRNCDSFEQLARYEGEKLSLNFRKPPQTVFKGVVVRLEETAGFLINLSFGISVVDAVAHYELTLSDFAPTDLAAELLYLHEAKTLVMDELHSLNQRLQGAKIAAEEQAFTDTLTGLKNRRAMDFILSRYTETSEPFGLMHLDLDYFKAVNDTYGHAAGDYVLQQVARILVSETRKDDDIIRFGGDEFVLVLKGLVDQTLLAEIAERIIARLQEPIAYGGAQCRISGSIGLAISTRYSKPDANTMLRDADIALYKSKSAGRARSTFAAVV